MEEIMIQMLDLNSTRGSIIQNSSTLQTNTKN